jgi:hypothetical protein
MTLETLLMGQRIPARVRYWAPRVAASAALLASASAIAYAGAVPKTWTGGEPLRSVDLNQNFQNVDARVSMLESAASGYAATSSVTGLEQRVMQLEAAVGAGETPQQVVGKFNMAVAGGASVTLGAVTPASVQFDLRWMAQHAAAAGACAAASPIGDSPNGHVVVPKPAAVTCTAACAANTSGIHTNCRTSIAVGSILPTQAQSYTDIVALNYNYGCGDSQSAYDEVAGQGLSTDYTAYCCCYH